mgnify:CR=1 FL=1
MQSFECKQELVGQCNYRTRVYYLTLETTLKKKKRELKAPLCNCLTQYLNPVLQEFYEKSVNADFFHPFCNHIGKK